MLMIRPVPSMMVNGSCRRSVEHCRSNSIRSDSDPGIRTCPVWQASSAGKNIHEKYFNPWTESHDFDLQRQRCKNFKGN
jgi:hypothetical protein